MDELSSELKRQIEGILRAREKEPPEAWFFELLSEAFGIGDPPEEDRKHLASLFNLVLAELPFQDAIIVIFDLGRAYQKRQASSE